jgi:Fur family ferric uptake transcriptional regulator
VVPFPHGSPKRAGRSGRTGSPRPVEPVSASDGPALRPATRRSSNASSAKGQGAWRRTRQRDAVRTVLVETGEFRTAREIHAALLQRGDRVGLTTVYRILQLFVDLDEVDTLRSANGDGMYRLRDDKHHHYLMCRSCGRVVEVTGPTVESWTERVADEHGFTDVGHSLEIFGTCADCIK